MDERAPTPRPRLEEPSRRSVSARGLVRRLVRSERGTALVEFALIAPILFGIVFMIIDFGRALNYYNDLTQLAGQGARAAVVSRNPDGTAIGTGLTCRSTLSIQCQIATKYPTDGELKDGVSVCLGTLNPDGKTIDTNTTPAVGAPITVRTRFVFNFGSFLTGFFHFGSYTLSSTQTERLEAPRTWDEGNFNGGPKAVDACSP